jgi:hypothetical protein
MNKLSPDADQATDRDPSAVGRLIFSGALFRRTFPAQWGLALALP